MKKTAHLSPKVAQVPAPAQIRKQAGAPALLPLLVLGIVCLACCAPGARAQDVDIGVRSKVMDKDLQWGHKTDAPEEGGHSKTFAIVAIEEVKAADKLVRPVDQQNILEQLYEQLLANGFTKYAKGTKPDILLAVSYGRGEMHNPYFHEQGEIGGFAPPMPPAGSILSPGPIITDATSVTLTGAVAIGQTVFDHKTPGYEAKLQKAGFEKLFIRVTAFAYPTDKKAKLKMLWKTIIVADDPDHRDLNKIAAEMLKAGAPYFDKDIKKPEIEFWHGVPKGQVNVGTPEVVQTDMKK
jgi:hypothetical protein